MFPVNLTGFYFCGDVKTSISRENCWVHSPTYHPAIPYLILYFQIITHRVIYPALWFVCSCECCSVLIVLLTLSCHVDRRIVITTRFFAKPSCPCLELFLSTLTWNSGGLQILINQFYSRIVTSHVNVQLKAVTCFHLGSNSISY